MLTMISTLWAASGLQKYWAYLLVALIVMASLVGAYMSGRSSGRAAESTKRLQDSLKTLTQEAKARAEIQSVSTSVARKQLRQRWSKN